MAAAKRAPQKEVVRPGGSPPGPAHELNSLLDGSLRLVVLRRERLKGPPAALGGWGWSGTLRGGRTVGEETWSSRFPSSESGRRVSLGVSRGAGLELADCPGGGGTVLRVEVPT